MTRGNVIKALEICGTNEHCHSCPYYRSDDCLGSMMLDAKTIIVNSAPVKHGEWDAKNSCSICGCQPWYERDIHFLHYCPNCGAKMDGGKDDGHSN